MYRIAFLSLENLISWSNYSALLRLEKQPDELFLFIVLLFKVLIIIFQCNGNMQSSISVPLSFFEIHLLPKVKEPCLKIKKFIS